MGKDAAFVDIGNDNHWHIGFFGKAHVSNIPIAQVDFCRTTGTFDNHGFIAFGQIVKGFEHFG